VTDLATVQEPANTAAGQGNAPARESTHCFHCGTRCRADAFKSADHIFCCHGCLTVFELLTATGLTDFYSLDHRAGVRVSAHSPATKFAYLDDPIVRERLVDFSNASITRVTFRLPAIHCIACVWLLENLFRIRAGIGQTQVNFLRKEASITFETDRIKLSELVALLASLCYEPDLKLADLDTNSAAQNRFATPRKLSMQLGVAGFAFGNNMLFSIAIYLGLDAFHGPSVQRLVGYLSMVLALPVLLYSAQDYFRLAWTGLKHKLLTIEVPIAAGILVIFAQSAFEVLTNRGEGYFDSFAGLLFFLLCGRLFQQKTYSRLAFDRDFKSFFPLAITRLNADSEESVSLSQLSVGDCLLIRNGELIPADSRLLNGQALIDYSFVTGEADPVEKKSGDLIYAGGRQIGGAIEVQTTKAVSQSYLTSLWNQDAFTKPTAESLDTLINRYSQRFTKIILAIALGSSLFWAFVQPSLSLKALTSVLIVACPCALALAAPFTLGTAIRLLGRRNIFVKSPEVIERLAQIDSIVFDKTGTLTAAGAASIQFEGALLSSEETHWIHSLARHSTHPYSARISEATRTDSTPDPVRSFLEILGCGVEANVCGHEIALGSAQWLRTRAQIPDQSTRNASIVHVVIDNTYRGAFFLTSALRRDVQELIPQLSSYNLSLLSGDNAKERAAFESLFGKSAELRFNQSPATKLEFVHALQSSGCKVMMVGDGLNDAGALKQSNVGVAVVESIGGFSPASDIIIAASVVPRLASVLRFSKGAVRIVRLSFVLSTLYNIVGIAIAAQGLLAPIVCAILMPLSSISVVAFACLATTWYARRAGLNNQPSNSTQAKV
jgi:P-type Cu+ transporter